MEFEQDLVVYVLVRNDLPSMNPGKAMAQVHHQGVQLVTKHAQHALVKRYVELGVQQGADHFNTTIVLGAHLAQIQHVQQLALELDPLTICWDQVQDPSYPFFVENMEIANLIPHTDDVKVIKVMDDGRVLMTRPEVTCAGFLGDRDLVQFRALFDGLDLHP